MRHRRRRPPVVVAVLAAVAVAFFVLPLIGLLQRAPWSDLVDDLTDPVVRDALRLSLICSVGATALAFVLGLPLAWVLARTDFPGRHFVRALVLLPMVLPPVVGGVALLLAFGRRGLVGQYLDDWFGVTLPFTTWGAILAEAFVAMPFFVIVVEAGLRSLDRRYEEAAATLGASRFTTFRRVVVPLIAPSLVAGAALTWARALGEFGATILFAGNLQGETQTMPLAIFVELQTNLGGAIALSLVLLAVSIVVLVSLRDRWFPRVSLEAAVGINLGQLALDVAISARPDETVVLLGPNGAGKTTVLRAVAGLLPLDSGRVRLDGQVLDDPETGEWIPPERRAVGYVFQDHALFPHMSALDNVAFGLRARGVRRGEANRRAHAWLERVGVSDHAGVRPRALSGGQAQRLALARALVLEPRVLLLDEPLAALDATARVDTRRQLGRHLGEHSGARVVVTHDPVDAMTLGDRVVVIESGRVVQAGGLAELREQPRSRYVADLVGVNLYRGRAEQGRIRLPDGGELVVADPTDGDVFAVVHPYAVALHRREPEGTPRNVFAGTVEHLDVEGDRVRVMVAGPVPVTAEVTPAAVAELELAAGTDVWASIKATEISVYPA